MRLIISLIGLILLCSPFTVPAASDLIDQSPAPSTETPADHAIKAAETLVERAPQLPGSYIALATALIRKVRESGDARYYQRAERAVQQLRSLQPASPEALRLQAWIEMGQHQFSAARKTAERLLKLQPDDHRAYGLLGDAYVELGDYDQATAAWQKMIDLRPGPASYSRAAHLRALMGDQDGATELMAMAVRATSPRDPESRAWLLVQYGQLHFDQGHLEVADAAYAEALRVLPRYYRALAAQGRVRSAQKRYEEAMTLYRQAIEIVPEPLIIARLGDVLQLTGQVGAAEQQYKMVEFITELNASNEMSEGRDAALFYADHDRKLDDALELAESERAKRHDIYSYDALAWVYYKLGRLTAAWSAMQQALRLGTRNASLMYHAGMITYGLGDVERAQQYLRQALETNPYFSLLHAEQARQTLAEMQRTAQSSTRALAICHSAAGVPETCG